MHCWVAGLRHSVVYSVVLVSAGALVGLPFAVWLPAVAVSWEALQQRDLSRNHRYEMRVRRSEMCKATEETVCASWLLILLVQS